MVPNSLRMFGDESMGGLRLDCLVCLRRIAVRLRSFCRCRVLVLPLSLGVWASGFLIDHVYGP